MSNLQTFYKKFAIHKKDRLSFQRVNNTIIGKKCPSNYINLGNLILSAFTNRPKFIGQIDAETGEEITFHQMREESVKLALWLKKRGIKKEDRVTICTCNQMLAYVPFLACIYLNLVVFPWDTVYIKNIMRTLYFLMESKPDVIFIDDEIIAEFEMALIIARLHDKMRIFPKIIILDKKSGLTKGYDSLGSILNSEFDQFDIDMFTCAKHSEKERIITMYSSNTANYPGEAYICYGAFLAPSNNQTPVMKSDDIGLWYESLNWTHSLLLTIRCILYYVTAIKASTFSHENLCQIVDKYKVTWVFLKTNMCNKLSDTNIFKKYKLFSLKKVLFGDTAIRRDIHENLIKSLPNASIIQVYCLSETGVIAYQRHTGKIGSSGHVSNNIQLMFINSKTRQPVGPYTHGEIWCQSPIKLGGFDRVKKLQSKYDAKRSCEGWYYTGDVGYFNENGEIFVIGKLRDIIQFDGSSIVPTKIEDVLQRHPAVSEAAVVGIKDEVVGQLPTAFVTKMPGAKITKEELMEYVEDNMAGYYVLRGGLRFLKSKMPYLPNGRIDRLRVKHMPCESDEDEDYDEDYE
ncbi:luciferin 4-monooxygenase-like isoform X2 [Cataglyphis hispanica]|uniref:luciferin 4-monooxygenase-like isoform X2 n=1 Tax=Cataglyphis hispanica TaxID=1086592 RepID=UPI00217F287C|nr:luciferin 4-monooxygenase-like isoform X2 [Cataglyphis hispanica]